MSADEQFGMVIILIYLILFGVLALIELLPAIINAIGLARICHKLQAFRPLWSWVWAFAMPAVALLRAGDVAAEREDPYKRKLFGQGVWITVLFLASAMLSVVCLGIAVMASLFAWPAIWVMISLIAMIALLVPALVLAVWAMVLLYISYFRIFKAYMPAWGAWLCLAGMIVFQNFAFLLLPVLSFIPLRQPPREI